MTNFVGQGLQFISADGSGTIAAGGTAQNLFSGEVPPHGYSVYNDQVAGGDMIWFNEGGIAAENAPGSHGLFPGGYYETPPGYQPTGVVSIFGLTTGDAYTAKQW